MNDTACDAVVAGHLCFDLIPKMLSAGDFAHTFVPGTLINVAEAAMSTGGPVSNTGIALHKLGIRTALMGKVGRDLFGRAILDLLKQYGADKTMTVVDDGVTSYTVVVAPPGIDRMFLHNPGVNDTFGHEDVNFDIVAKARLFHLGYPPLMKRMYSNGGRELIETFRRAREAGATTSLDMALPDIASEAGKIDWRAIVTEVLPHVDLYVPSVEETLLMLDKDRFLARKEEAGQNDVLDFISPADIASLGQALLDCGARIVLLKCGHRGVYLRTAGSDRLADMGRARPAGGAEWSDRELWQPSYRVEHLASAAGSGDSAIAGFLAAFLKGERVLSCLRYACAVGAHNVEALDAVSGVRSWEETTEAIGRFEQNDPGVAAEGWTFDTANRAWTGPADSGGA